MTRYAVSPERGLIESEPLTVAMDRTGGLYDTCGTKKNDRRSSDKLVALKESTSTRRDDSKLEWDGSHHHSERFNNT